LKGKYFPQISQIKSRMFAEKMSIQGILSVSAFKFVKILGNKTKIRFFKSPDTTGTFQIIQLSVYLAQK